MSAINRTVKKIAKCFGGYLWSVAGVLVITPLVLQVHSLVGLRYSALLYLLITIAVYYYSGIGPALFSVMVALCATSYFLLPPTGAIWPIFREEDQLLLVFMAFVSIAATGAATLIRKSSAESATLAARTAELAATTTTLERNLNKRIQELDELKPELAQARLLIQELGNKNETTAHDLALHDEQLTILHQLTECIAWFPLKTASERILDNLTQYFKADLASVWTYTVEGSSISLIAEKGYLDGLLRPQEILYIPYDGLLHKILSSGSPFCGVPDSSGPFLRLTYASGVKSLAVVPLRCEDAITGFLSIGSKDSEGFAPDMRMLKTVANLLSLSMKIAQQKINLEIWREVA